MTTRCTRCRALTQSTTAGLCLACVTSGYVQVGPPQPQPPSVVTVYVPPCPACAEKQASIVEVERKNDWLIANCNRLTGELSDAKAEIARLTALVKGGPCETCQHKIDQPLGYTACRKLQKPCYLMGHGCYAHEPKEDSDART